MRPTKATDAEIRAALDGLAGWELVDDRITTRFEFPSFADAIAFVVRVGFLAEAMNHHPDIDVRYRTVRVTLSTHDVDGLSALDFEFAAQIDGVLLAPEIPESE